MNRSDSSSSKFWNEMQTLFASKESTICRYAIWLYWWLLKLSLRFFMLSKYELLVHDFLKTIAVESGMASSDCWLHICTLVGASDSSVDDGPGLNVPTTGEEVSYFLRSTACWYKRCTNGLGVPIRDVLCCGRRCFLRERVLGTIYSWQWAPTCSLYTDDLFHFIRSGIGIRNPLQATPTFTVCTCAKLFW